MLCCVAPALLDRRLELRAKPMWNASPMNFVRSACAPRSDDKEEMPRLAFVLPLPSFSISIDFPCNAPSALPTIENKPEPGRIRHERILFCFWRIEILRGPWALPPTPVLLSNSSDRSDRVVPGPAFRDAPGMSISTTVFVPVFSAVCPTPMPGGRGASGIDTARRD